MTVMAIYLSLAVHGCSVACGAGIIANLQAESGLQSCIASASGVGMPQLAGPRRRRFLAWAGRSWCDARLQIEYVVHELGEFGMKERLFRATDPGQAAAYFQRQYERPAARGTQYRERLAWQIYGQLHRGNG